MFTRSLIEIVPLINDKFNDIRNMIYDIPENIMIENKETIEVISEIRKKVYIAQMEKRYEKLLLPEYEKIKSQGKNGLSTDIINIEHIADKIETFIECDGLTNSKNKNDICK